MNICFLDRPTIKTDPGGRGKNFFSDADYIKTTIIQVQTTTIHGLSFLTGDRFHASKEENQMCQSKNISLDLIAFSASLILQRRLATLSHFSAISGTGCRELECKQEFLGWPHVRQCLCMLFRLCFVLGIVCYCRGSGNVGRTIGKLLSL